MKADRKQLIMELLEDYKNGKLSPQLGMMILHQIMTSRELTKEHFREVKDWILKYDLFQRLREE